MEAKSKKWPRLNEDEESAAGLPVPAYKWVIDSNTNGPLVAASERKAIKLSNTNWPTNAIKKKKKNDMRASFRATQEQKFCIFQIFLSYYTVYIKDYTAHRCTTQNQYKMASSKQGLHVLLLLLICSFSTDAAATVNTTAPCLPDQASSLLQLKSSFIVANNLSSWRAGTDCCHWTDSTY